MTKKEFEEYIASFKRNVGEYTDEEVYKIGVAHKSLDKVDKNWSKLAKTLGVCDSNGETLRCTIKRLQRIDNTLPKNKRELNSRTIEDVSEEDFAQQIDDLYKQQVKTRDTYNAYRKLIRDEARIENLKDLIKEGIANLSELPSVTSPSKSKSVKNKTEAILMLSDLHIGVECNNFYNQYNVQIARNRVNKLVEDTIRYCRANNVHTLNVLNLGDLVHGIIHVSARLEQSVDIIKQIMIASEILSDALNKLQEASPVVVYRSVVDNHSRVIANKHEHIEKENLSKLIDWYIKERLSSSNIVFEEDNLDDGLGHFYLNNGKHIVFAHGHQDNINSCFQHFVGATEEYVHYCLLGHYHCEKAKSYEGSRVIVNGSIVGTEQYALSKRLFSKPSQTLLIFEEDNLINISVNLNIK